MHPQSEKASSKQGFQEPFFIQLKRFVAENPQNVENQLKQLRTDRLLRLQELRQSQLIVYYSLESLTRRDAELFYEALTTLADVKNLDLFLLSPGGLSDPAFKMAYLCQECVGEANGTLPSEGRFSVLIPYYAKSAATILTLGADELVMGEPSELGPIDPQLRMSAKKPPLPLHALRDALQYIEERANNFSYARLLVSLSD
jgi:ClpP class serine protease